MLIGLQQSRVPNLALKSESPRFEESNRKWEGEKFLTENWKYWEEEGRMGMDYGHRMDTESPQTKACKSHEVLLSMAFFELK